jgi:hypothetical protein
MVKVVFSYKVITSSSIQIITTANIERGYIMSNYLLALLLSIFLASAGGVVYFQKYPEHRHVAEDFVKHHNSTPHEREAPETPNHGGVARAPEINASSGTNAIAILIGVLLLVSEKYRANRC